MVSPCGEGWVICLASRVRVCVCACVHARVVMRTRCLESPSGILGIGDSRKSGHTLNLSLQHNPHNERIQGSSHTLAGLALALTLVCG